VPHTRCRVCHSRRFPIQSYCAPCPALQPAGAYIQESFTYVCLRGVLILHHLNLTQKTSHFTGMPGLHACLFTIVLCLFECMFGPFVHLQKRRQCVFKSVVYLTLNARLELALTELLLNLNQMPQPEWTLLRKQSAKAREESHLHKLGDLGPHAA
jgi:hypothetical protein